MTPYIATGAISPKMIGAPPPLEGPRVTLDQASFRALASEVRVEVLKRLDEQRMTVPDPANAPHHSKPTLLLVGFGLAAAGLWFIGVALFFKIRGDNRRAKVFATLDDL